MTSGQRRTMLDRMLGRYAAIDTGDPEHDRRARTLIGMLALLAIGLLMVTAMYWTGPYGVVSGIIDLTCAVACLALIPVVRRGHLEGAVLGLMAIAMIITVALPMINGDLSTYPDAIAALAIIMLFVLRSDRRWWTIIWVLLTVGILLAVTSDAQTIPMTRTAVLANSVVVAGIAITMTICGMQEMTEGWRRERRLTEELKANLALVAELEHAANRDPLTGLLNRRALAPLLDTVLEEDEDGGAAVGVIDLDGFKAVNDEVSHEAGDGALRMIAEQFEQSSRNSDLLFRLGGDEFTIISATGGVAGLGAWLERQRRGLAEIDWAGLGLPPVTLSAGLVAAGGVSVAKAMRMADVALYEAKARGRDMVVIRDH